MSNVHEFIKKINKYKYIYTVYVIFAIITILVFIATIDEQAKNRGWSEHWKQLSR